ncbi:hypothetical protein DYI24_14895 [Rhodopseudomonas sp. BR0C11]|uniref:hypothetical protein n=1 Tax=Rhodopseudomonas sp. BR0C11 TaxID=2269370 RepID=UPI0013DEBCEE|nr:hypothetical protein [Rhodopseudomonas sp. BR0C11]NEV78328.1 hypothetical protein [Rhodopseudomonas sp. BR0C11]
MTKMDFEKAKTDIVQIVEIVNTVPEPLRLRCFELLFEKAFSGSKFEREPDEKSPAGEQKTDQNVKLPAGNKIPGNIKAILNRGDATEDDIAKLFMLEHEPMLPVYKIPSGSMAKAQMMKVMMVLLENGLLSNSLSAPYSELRQAVKDDGFFDSNFNKTLKRSADLFKGAITGDSIDENGSVELTGQGLKKLAETIKELAQ